MINVVVSRLLRLVATLLAVSLITFLMVDILPGDPVAAIIGIEGLQDPELVARTRAELRLDDPTLVRYGHWLKSVVVDFDLGRSSQTGQPVINDITARLPVTAQLAFMAVGMAVIMAIPIGVIGAYRQGRMADQVTSATSQIALSVPNFVTGIFLIWLFAYRLGWLPASGWSRISERGVVANLKSAILPASALALTQTAIFSRLVRADMIATLQENFIMSARAKGLRDRYILFRHALRPSSLSLMTIVGINFGALLGGTVVIEHLFAIPGLGQRLINGINQRDIILIQGVVMFIATMYVVINTLVDLLYSAVDPRIRRS